MELHLRPWTIARLWLPLALTWAMMAAEGLILQSVLSRLPAAAANLAAFGVAIGIAFIVESPIIMLLSASTAYVKGAASYRVVRRFAFGLSAGVTAVMLLLMLPPVYDVLAESVLALPSHVSTTVYWCIVALLPWPGLIGVRRFYQGVIIRARLNTYIAAGTLFRLFTIVIGAFAMYSLLPPHSNSAIAACGVLTCAVALETIATRWMAQTALRRTLDENDPSSYRLTTSQLARLYIPLALTSIVAMGIGPVLTAFMTRFPNAIESLAVYPVVDGFVFQFRSPLFAYQEVAISLFAVYGFTERMIKHVGYCIAAISTGVLATVVATPLAAIVYGVFPYQLSTSLELYAVYATAILLPLPFASAVYSIERAVLIVADHSKLVAYSTFIEAGVTVAFLSVLALMEVRLAGVFATTFAISIGKIAAATYLLRSARHYGRG
mgnify:FL=1